MMKKKIFSCLLVLSLLFSVFSVEMQAQAATSPVKLAKKELTLKIVAKDGKTSYGKATIKVKKSKGIKIKKTTFKSKNKKIATVSKKGKVTAKKKGSTKISVKVTYLKKGKTNTKTLLCKITVKKQSGTAKRADVGSNSSSSDASSGNSLSGSNSSGNSSTDNNSSGSGSSDSDTPKQESTEQSEGENPNKPGTYTNFYTSILFDGLSFYLPDNECYIENEGSTRKETADQMNIKDFAAITYPHIWAKDVIGLTNHNIKSNYTYYMTGTDVNEQVYLSTDDYCDMPIFTRNSEDDKTYACYVFGAKNTRIDSERGAKNAYMKLGDQDNPWLANPDAKLDGSLDSASDMMSGSYIWRMYAESNGPISKENFEHCMKRILWGNKSVAANEEYGEDSYEVLGENREPSVEAGDYFIEKVDSDTVKELNAYYDEKAKKWGGYTLYVLRVAGAKTVPA